MDASRQESGIGEQLLVFEKPYDVVEQIMLYEQSRLSNEDIMELFSRLIKSGLAWRLQGEYGRIARILILSGRIDSTGTILRPWNEDD